MLHRCVIYGLIVCGFIIYITMDMPLSLLYSYSHTVGEMRGKAVAANNARVILAKEYIKRIESSMASKLTITGTELDLVVMIVSVSRQQHKNASYLLQTAASMHNLLIQDTLFQRKTMFICNVDPTPSQNNDAELLQSHVYFINKVSLLNNMGIQSMASARLVNSGLKDPARMKEIEDYVFCLNVSLSLKPRYILALEDDVLPTHDLFPILNYTLTEINKNNVRTSSRKTDTRRHPGFSFLKLYYPARWQGYELDFNTILELSVVFCLGFGISVLLELCSVRSRKHFGNCKTHDRKYRHDSTRLTRNQLACVMGVVCVICVSIIGRVNFIEFRRFTPRLMQLTRSRACCTQAMVYPAEIVPTLVRHLVVNNTLNKDLAIYDFSVKYEIPGYQLQPNMFHHTGMTTSLSNITKHPEEFLLKVHPSIFSPE